MEKSAALHWGKHILVKMLHSLAPSSFAASMRLEGILRINFVSRKTEKGANAPGRIIDHRVLSIPSFSLTR